MPHGYERREFGLNLDIKQGTIWRTNLQCSHGRRTTDMLYTLCEHNCDVSTFFCFSSGMVMPACGERQAEPTTVQV